MPKTNQEKSMLRGADLPPGMRPKAPWERDLEQDKAINWLTAGLLTLFVAFLMSCWLLLVQVGEIRKLDARVSNVEAAR